jgi:isopentenyl-diphosphate delta-isomerase
MSIKEVILVDSEDRDIGYLEKMEAHQQGLLHRAFSIFILNSPGEMLLQRRALTKYHSPGLWTNACCSHPAPGENTLQSANQRLEEEMGFNCNLTEIGSFTYRTTFENNLIEHEFDHVFIGKYEGDIVANKEEVEEFKWISIDSLEEDMKRRPESYTFWFHIAYPILKSYLAVNSET